VDTLEGWLGEGELTLTNIFTKTPGATSEDFHAAADLQGRTFTVFRATEYFDAENYFVTAIVGGYNPQSWESLGDYHYTPLEEMRTAFLFNLDTDTLYPQLIFSTEHFGSGVFQTYNSDNYGPVFGGGFDLAVNSSLIDGSAYGYSYAQLEDSIVTGKSDLNYEITIGDLEVFTIRTLSVPEPGTLALFGVGLFGLAMLRRRHKAYYHIRGRTCGGSKCGLGLELLVSPERRSSLC